MSTMNSYVVPVAGSRATSAASRAAAVLVVMALVLTTLSVAHAAPIAATASAEPLGHVATAAAAGRPMPTVAPPQGTLPQTGCVISGSDATCDLWAKTGTIGLPGAASPVAILAF